MLYLFADREAVVKNFFTFHFEIIKRMGSK